MERSLNRKKLRFLMRIISMLLVVVFVSEEFLGSGNIVLASPQEEAAIEEIAAETEEETAAEDLQVLFELEDFREQNSKQYRMSDGTVMAAEYGYDVHYKDGENEWKDIDNRFLYEAADGNQSEGFATAEGEVKYRFALDASENEVVKATTGDYSVGFALIREDAQEAEAAAALEEGELLETDRTGSSLPITFIRGDVLNYDEAELDLLAVPAETSAAALSETEDDDEWIREWEGSVSSEESDLMEQTALDNAVTSVGYEDVMEGVSLQYVTYGSSLKEYIIVNEKQEDYRYVFALELEGLVPQMQADNSILLKDEENGTAVYEIPVAYMTDASGDYSEAVEMEITEDASGNYLLAVEADKNWIDEEGRVFPVQIDPTLNRVFSTQDNLCGSYVCQGIPEETNLLNPGSLFIGYDSSGNQEMITYVQMQNLPEIPQNSVICAAKLHFKIEKFTQVAYPKLYMCMKKISGTAAWQARFNWNTKPALDDTILDYRTITSDKQNTYEAWNITQLVKEHYEMGNDTDVDVTTFAIRAFDGSAMGSSSCANAAIRLSETTTYPVLQIFYRDTRGVEDYYTYQTQDLGYAGTGYVGDYNSQLTVSKTIASYNSTIMSYSLGIVYNSEMVKLFCNTKQDKDTLINVGFFFQMVLSNHLRNVDVYGYNIHIHILPLPD